MESDPTKTTTTAFIYATKKEKSNTLILKLIALPLYSKDQPRFL